MQRKLVAAAVSSALALPMTAQAVEFAVSGHVNRAILSVDNHPSGDDDLRHVDSNASQSRFRLKGSEELENGMTAGVNLEMGVLSTGSSSGTTTRHAALFLDTPGGKLTMGHTGVATDGATNARLGGPSWLGGVTNWCAYYSDSNPACQTHDGGRTDILRYDTPALGPATLSVSAGDNDYWDVALKLAGSFGEAGYDFRIGYTPEYEVPRPDMTSTTPASSRTVVETTPDRWRFNVDGDALFAELDGDPMTANPSGTPNSVEQHKAANSMPEGTQYFLHAENNPPVNNDGNGLADADAFNGANWYNVFIPGTTTTREVATAATTTTTPQTPTKAGDIVAASAALSFGQGTSLAVAWAEDTNPKSASGLSTDGSYLYAEVDHSYGDGSVGVYWKEGEKDAGDGTSEEGSLWGVGIGHNIGAGVTAYAGYRRNKRDNVSDDISIIVAGMRVQFK